MSLLWFNKLENPLIYSRLIQDLFKRVLDMSAHVYTCSRQNLNISVKNSGDSKSDKQIHNASAIGFGQNYINIWGHMSYILIFTETTHFLVQFVCLLIYQRVCYKRNRHFVKDQRSVLCKFINISFFCSHNCSIQTYFQSILQFKGLSVIHSSKQQHKIISSMHKGTWRDPKLQNFKSPKTSFLHG